MSFLLCIVELRLSTLDKPISDLIWTTKNCTTRKLCCRCRNEIAQCHVLS